MIKGHVDDQLRALIPIAVRAHDGHPPVEITAWVDTAFNGTLVMPRQKIQELGLVQESSAEAVLADGSAVELETFACLIEWFGSSYETQVVANDSEFALLGTLLLAERRVEIDYPGRTVSIG